MHKKEKNRRKSKRESFLDCASKIFEVDGFCIAQLVRRFLNWDIAQKSSSSAFSG